MKSNKGFTLVEVVVSFALISIVMLYIIKVIVVISKENTIFMEEENFSIYEETILNKIYSDIDDAENVIITESNDSIIITSDDFDSNKVLKIKDNNIIYDGIMYELPSGMSFNNDSYNLVTRDDYYLIKININIGNSDKTIKIVKLIKS